MESNGNGIHFTATQQRILDTLSDGYGHLATDLEGLLYNPEQGQERDALHSHIVLLRKKLRPKGEDIILQRRDGRSYYIHVRLTASPYLE